MAETEPQLPQEEAGHAGDAKVEVVHVKKIQGSDELAEAKLLTPPRPLSKSMLWTYVMCIAPYMCGTMAGYDGAVMGSFLVEPAFQKIFGTAVNGFEAGYITAMYQIGSCFAIFFIGESLDRFGRRFGIFLGCALSVLGSIIQGTSASTGSLSQFLAGRFLLGFGSTIAQAAGSTYVVEISHPVYRGLMTGGQSTMLNFGSLFAAAVTLGTVNIVGNGCWTIPTWTQAICPGIACVLVYLFPESPRWQYTHNKQESAKRFLTKYHGGNDENNPYVQLQLTEFEQCLDLNGSDKKWWDYRVLFSTPAQRLRLGNSLMIGIWGALSNGGISYFVGAFFNSAGITDAETVLRFNVWQSFLSFMGSFIGSPMTERFGRRPLLLWTLFGMGLCWAAVAVGTAIVENDPANVAAANAGIAFYFIFCFVYCIGITPLQGVYAVEVFSYEQRGKGMGFSNLFVSACGLINQFGTPVALADISWKTYIIFCVWNFVEFAISYFFSVETKGFTLEELDAIFESPNPVKASTQRRDILVDEENHVIEDEKKV